MQPKTLRCECDTFDSTWVTPPVCLLRLCVDGGCKNSRHHRNGLHPGRGMGNACQYPVNLSLSPRQRFDQLNCPASSPRSRKMDPFKPQPPVSREKSKPRLHTGWWLLSNAAAERSPGLVDQTAGSRVTMLDLASRVAEIGGGCGCTWQRVETKISYPTMYGPNRVLRRNTALTALAAVWVPWSLFGVRAETRAISCSWLPFPARLSPQETGPRDGPTSSEGSS